MPTMFGRHPLTCSLVILLTEWQTNCCKDFFKSMTLLQSYKQHSSTLQRQASTARMYYRIFLIQFPLSNNIQHIDRYTTKEVTARLKHDLQPPCVDTSAVYWKYLKKSVYMYMITSAHQWLIMSVYCAFIQLQDITLHKYTLFCAAEPNIGLCSMTVHPSHAGNASKLLIIGSCTFRRPVAWGL